MSYTNIERQAIIKLLSDMMMVDGHSDQQEKQYLEYVKNLFGLTSVPFDSTMDRNRAFSVISNMSDDQKMYNPQNEMFVIIRTKRHFP